MVEDDDWRVTPDKAFLEDREVRWTDWSAPSPSWDHDHCVFCWAKFAAVPSGNREYSSGWVTPDDHNNWICPPCFDELRERFRWRVVA